jgi:hypothetical protein
VAGIVLGSWGRAWIWVALVLFIVIGILMTPVGGTYLRNLRLAIGQPPRNAKPGDPDPVPATDEQLAAMRASNRPEILLLLGAGGFVLILWLMMFKPF